MKNPLGWKKTLYAVWAGELLAIAGFSTSGPILPFFLQDLGVTDPVALKFFTGLISTLPAIMLAIFAPIWGSFADNYGRKPMLLRALFGGTVVLLLQGFVTDPWQLLALRTLQGCLTGTVAAAIVLVASVAPKEEAGGALGLIQMAIFIGASLGPMFGGIISDAWGHRATFFATSILLLIGGLIVLKFVDDTFVPPKNRKSILATIIPDFSPLTETKVLWVLLAVVAADQISGTITGPFLPLFIQSITPAASRVGSMTGIILGVGALSSAVASAVLGKISFRLGYARVLVFCMAGAALFSIPQAFVHTPIALLVLRIASCFFVGGNMPAVNALISQNAKPGKQGAIYGLSSSTASVSGAIGPVIGASFAAIAGYGSVFIATGAILAFSGGAIAVFLKRSGRPTLPT